MRGARLLVAADDDSSDACEKAGAVCDQIYEWTDNETLAELLSFLVGVPVKILLVLVIALIINRLGRKWSLKIARRVGKASEDTSLVSERSSVRATERAETVGSLLRSLVTAITFGVALLLIMELIGIDATDAILSAGVLAIAVGFGAQSVVADMFAGIFMLAEDQYGVGDRIDAGPVNGYVERITLRTTVIRDSNGKLWHIPNSQIDYVANETQSWARAVVIIGISYDTDISEAVRVLTQATRAVAESDEWAEHVQKDPEVQAVQELGDNAVDLRVLVHVDPDRRRGIERALRYRCKEALDAAGIEMPNDQLDVFVRKGGIPDTGDEQTPGLGD